MSTNITSTICNYTIVINFPKKYKSAKNKFCGFSSYVIGEDFFSFTGRCKCKKYLHRFNNDFKTIKLQQVGCLAENLPSKEIYQNRNNPFFDLFFEMPYEFGDYVYLRPGNCKTGHKEKIEYKKDSLYRYSNGTIMYQDKVIENCFYFNLNKKPSKKQKDLFKQRAQTYCDEVGLKIDRIQLIETKTITQEIVTETCKQI